MSYVGELGYELYIPTSNSHHLMEVFDTLNSFDQVTLAGFEALNSMSLEKGHRHWHGDIETTDLPSEAGLLFACKSQADFVGKNQLKSKKPRKRWASFTTSPEVALNGHEAIYRSVGKMLFFLYQNAFLLFLPMSAELSGSR